MRASGDEETQDDRVVLTAQYWKLGFSGGQFPSQLLQTAEDVREAASRLSMPDVILSEYAGSNNTLDVSTCSNYNDVPAEEGERGAQFAFASSTVVPVIGSRLVSRFASAGVLNLEFTGQDLLNVAMLCSFDTLGRATVNKGRLSLEQSGFCNVFERNEWPIVGYAFDVGKWKGQGYGNRYNRALGTGFLRELIARLNGTGPPLLEPTSLNATLDGNRKTFPLPNSTAGPVFFFDGSHDNSEIEGHCFTESWPFTLTRGFPRHCPNCSIARSIQWSQYVDDSQCSEAASRLDLQPNCPFSRQDCL